MATPPPQRIALVLPLRTILLVAGTIAVMWAFATIAEAFLIVFVGIFLALVFEYPVRLSSPRRAGRGDSPRR